MKFPARENNPELILGEAFVPGSGNNHFCKPSDVAVTPTGYFFVSDGYCNSRIMMFGKGGRFMKEIGAKGNFFYAELVSEFFFILRILWRFV